MHYYWYLTNDGIEFLRTYLNLPSEIVPATLKKSAKPLGRPMGGPPGDRPRSNVDLQGLMVTGHDLAIEKVTVEGREDLQVNLVVKKVELVHLLISNPLSGDLDEVVLAVVLAALVEHLQVNFVSSPFLCIFSLSCEW
ncbi:40S ribosomal protein S10 [Striga asiatica]|uniref:40S ribosomal protein S10 n=1 Tax=Striga asiatica TaxID=4170 RepID=A0A5A7QNH4_STRAF|nr:40S ribosomal protein S10 [Striga asiatica]